MSKKREQKALALKLRKRILRRIRYRTKKYRYLWYPLPISKIEPFPTPEELLDELYKFLENPLNPITKIDLPPSAYRVLENETEKLVKPSNISGLGIPVSSNSLLPPNTMLTVDSKKFTLFDVSGQEATIIAEFPKIDFFKLPPPRLERNLYAKRNE